MDPIRTRQAKKSRAPAFRPLRRREVGRPLERVADKAAGVEDVAALVRELVALVLVGQDQLRAFVGQRFVVGGSGKKMALTAVGIGYRRSAWSKSHRVGRIDMGRGER